MPDRKRSSAYQAPIYHGDQDEDRLPYEGPPIRTEPDPVNSGRHAALEGSGVVSGSGATAGGTAGISEEPGTDPIAGSGPNMMPAGAGDSRADEAMASAGGPARAPRDTKRISLAEDYEAEYWANRFGVSQERLKAAVDKVGASVDAVAEELNR